MSATADHVAGVSEPNQLTFRYTHNPGGIVTAQIAEFPAAISQGATQHEAYLNVVDALHDLTHEPTQVEKAAFTMQARVDDLIEELEDLGRRLRSAAVEALRDLGRDRVHM